MKKRRRSLVQLRKAGSVVSAIILSILCILTALSGILNHVILNENLYEETVSNDEFISDLKRHIDRALEIDCRIYNFPYDEIKDAVSKSELKRCSSEFISSMIDASTEKTEQVVRVEFSRDKIYSAIEKYASKAEPGSTFSDISNCEKLTDKLVDKINSILNTVGAQPMALKIASSVFTHKMLHSIANLFPAFLAAAILMAAEVVLLKDGNGYSKLYTLASSVWVASAICFAPIMLLKIYNLPVRLALADSYLRTFVTRIADSIINATFDSMLIFFAAASALLIASSVYYVVIRGLIKNGKKRRQKRLS